MAAIRIGQKILCQPRKTEVLSKLTDIYSGGKERRSYSTSDVNNDRRRNRKSRARDKSEAAEDSQNKSHEPVTVEEKMAGLMPAVRTMVRRLEHLIYPVQAKDAENGRPREWPKRTHADRAGVSPIATSTLCCLCRNDKVLQIVEHGNMLLKSRQSTSGEFRHRARRWHSCGSSYTATGYNSSRRHGKLFPNSNHKSQLFVCGCADKQKRFIATQALVVKPKVTKSRSAKNHVLVRLFKHDYSCFSRNGHHISRKKNENGINNQKRVHADGINPKTNKTFDSFDRETCGDENELYTSGEREDTDGEVKRNSTKNSPIYHRYHQLDERERAKLERSLSGAHLLAFRSYSSPYIFQKVLPSPQIITSAHHFTSLSNRQPPQWTLLFRKDVAAKSDDRRNLLKMNLSDMRVTHKNRNILDGLRKVKSFGDLSRSRYSTGLGGGNTTDKGIPKQVLHGVLSSYFRDNADDLLFDRRMGRTCKTKYNDLSVENKLFYRKSTCSLEHHSSDYKVDVRVIQTGYRRNPNAKKVKRTKVKPASSYTRRCKRDGVQLLYEDMTDILSESDGAQLVKKSNSQVVLTDALLMATKRSSNDSGWNTPLQWLDDSRKNEQTNSAPVSVSKIVKKNVVIPQTTTISNKIESVLTGEGGNITSENSVARNKKCLYEYNSSYDNLEEETPSKLKSVSEVKIDGVEKIAQALGVNDIEPTPCSNDKISTFSTNKNVQKEKKPTEYDESYNNLDVGKLINAKQALAATSITSTINSVKKTGDIDKKKLSLSTTNVADIVTKNIESIMNRKESNTAEPPTRYTPLPKFAFSKMEIENGQGKETSRELSRARHFRNNEHSSNEFEVEMKALNLNRYFKKTQPHSIENKRLTFDNEKTIVIPTRLNITLNFRRMEIEKEISGVVKPSSIGGQPVVTGLQDKEEPTLVTGLQNKEEPTLVTSLQNKEEPALSKDIDTLEFKRKTMMIEKGITGSGKENMVIGTENKIKSLIPCCTSSADEKIDISLVKGNLVCSESKPVTPANRLEQILMNGANKMEMNKKKLNDTRQSLPMNEADKAEIKKQNLSDTHQSLPMNEVDKAEIKKQILSGTHQSLTTEMRGDAIKNEELSAHQKKNSSDSGKKAESLFMKENATSFAEQQDGKAKIYLNYLQTRTEPKVFENDNGVKTVPVNKIDQQLPLTTEKKDTIKSENVTTYPEIENEIAMRARMNNKNENVNQNIHNAKVFENLTGRHEMEQTWDKRRDLNKLFTNRNNAIEMKIDFPDSDMKQLKGNGNLQSTTISNDVSVINDVQIMPENLKKEINRILSNKRSAPNENFISELTNKEAPIKSIETNYGNNNTVKTQNKDGFFNSYKEKLIAQKSLAQNSRTVKEKDKDHKTEKGKFVNKLEGDEERKDLSLANDNNILKSKISLTGLQPNKPLNKNKSLVYMNKVDMQITGKGIKPNALNTETSMNTSVEKASTEQTIKSVNMANGMLKETDKSQLAWKPNTLMSRNQKVNNTGHAGSGIQFLDYFNNKQSIMSETKESIAHDNTINTLNQLKVEVENNNYNRTTNKTNIDVLNKSFDKKADENANPEMTSTVHLGNKLTPFELVKQNPENMKKNKTILQNITASTLAYKASPLNETSRKPKTKFSSSLASLPTKTDMKKYDDSSDMKAMFKKISKTMLVEKKASKSEDLKFAKFSAKTSDVSLRHESPMNKTSVVSKMLNSRGSQQVQDVKPLTLTQQHSRLPNSPDQSKRFQVSEPQTRFMQQFNEQREKSLVEQNRSVDRGPIRQTYRSNMMADTVSFNKERGESTKYVNASTQKDMFNSIKAVDVSTKKVKKIAVENSKHQSKKTVVEGIKRQSKSTTHLATTEPSKATHIDGIQTINELQGKPRKSRSAMSMNASKNNDTTSDLSEKDTETFNTMSLAQKDQSENYYEIIKSKVTSLIKKLDTGRTLTDIFTGHVTAPEHTILGNNRSNVENLSTHDNLFFGERMGMEEISRRKSMEKMDRQTQNHKKQNRSASSIHKDSVNVAQEKYDMYSEKDKRRKTDTQNDQHLRGSSETESPDEKRKEGISDTHSFYRDSMLNEYMFGKDKSSTKNVRLSTIMVDDIKMKPEAENNPRYTLTKDVLPVNNRLEPSTLKFSKKSKKNDHLYYILQKTKTYLEDEEETKMPLKKKATKSTTELDGKYGGQESSKPRNITLNSILLDKSMQEEPMDRSSGVMAPKKKASDIFEEAMQKTHFHWAQKSVSPNENDARLNENDMRVLHHKLAESKLQNAAQKSNSLLHIVETIDGTKAPLRNLHEMASVDTAFNADQNARNKWFRNNTNLIPAAEKISVLKNAQTFPISEVDMKKVEEETMKFKLPDVKKKSEEKKYNPWDQEYISTKKQHEDAELLKNAIKKNKAHISPRKILKKMSQPYANDVFTTPPGYLPKKTGLYRVNKVGPGKYRIKSKASLKKKITGSDPGHKSRKKDKKRDLLVGGRGSDSKKKSVLLVTAKQQETSFEAKIRDIKRQQKQEHEKINVRKTISKEIMTSLQKDSNDFKPQSTFHQSSLKLKMKSTVPPPRSSIGIDVRKLYEVTGRSAAASGNLHTESGHGARYGLHQSQYHYKRGMKVSRTYVKPSLYKQLNTNFKDSSNFAKEVRTKRKEFRWSGREHESSNNDTLLNYIQADRFSTKRRQTAPQRRLATIGAGKSTKKRETKPNSKAWMFNTFSEVIPQKTSLINYIQADRKLLNKHVQETLSKRKSY